MHFAQFKAWWMLDLEDVKLVGKSKLRRGSEVARGPQFDYQTGLAYGYFVV